MLLNPTKIVFATNFLMVERLFKFKLAIEHIIANPNWTTFVNTLHDNHHQKMFTKVRSIWTNIKRDEFYNICANFVYMVEPILIALSVFDGKQPCMGRVWLIITRSTIWITIKPCRCDWRSILLKVEDVNNWLTLCRDFSQSIFIGWSSLTWWCKCKGGLKHILQKKWYPNRLCVSFRRLCKFC